MKRYLSLFAGLICTGATIFASGLDATATYTDSLVSPGVYQYDLTLNNTGTTPIGTFWFSWVPGDNFMSVSPTNIADPSGWGDIITTGGPSNGSAILWTANTTANELAAGNSLSGFNFDSTLTPTQLMGMASGTPVPITTTFVYIGQPFGDAGLQIVATPATIAATPEPGTIMITALAFGLIAFANYLLRKRSNALRSPDSLTSNS